MKERLYEKQEILCTINWVVVESTFVVSALILN